MGTSGRVEGDGDVCVGVDCSWTYTGIVRSHVIVDTTEQGIIYSLGQRPINYGAASVLTSVNNRANAITTSAVCCPS